MISKLRDMTVGDEIEIKNIGWQANKVINAIYNLQTYVGQEYLVNGSNDMILIRRVK